ncbi:MAG: hypothetical protein MJ227_00895 [Bacilli bacterium]|nr:hypothetical protein [Bacilli bacterium]
MTKLFEKINKWVIVGIAGVYGLLRLIGGIILVSKNTVENHAGTASLFSGLVIAAIAGLLIYFLIRDKKKEATIVGIVLAGSLVVSALTTAVSEWSMAYSLDRQLKEFGEWMSSENKKELSTAISYYVVYGIATLTMFVGAVAYMTPKLTQKVPQKVVSLVALISFAAAFVLFLVATIIYGNCEMLKHATESVANTILNIASMVEAVLLLVLMNKDF